MWYALAHSIPLRSLPLALIILGLAPVSLFSPMVTLVFGVVVGGESFRILPPFGFSAEFWSTAFLLPASWVGELMALMMRELMVLS